MDSLDRSILQCLSENSRQSATQISHKVHLSIAAVIERIRKLERNGIIRQYTIVADQQKIGNEVTALMEVSLEHPRYYEEFTRIMSENASIGAPECNPPIPDSPSASAFLPELGSLKHLSCNQTDMLSQSDL